MYDVINVALGEISPAELLKRAQTATLPLIIDVREPWEIERTLFPLPHRQIPMGQILTVLPDVDPEEEIVVACHFGRRSAHTCFILNNQGYKKVYNLKGGIDAWSQEIDPLIPRY
jgi:rhodanese-related sulfurtransferase